MTAYGRARGQPPQPWRVIAETYECPTCGAGGGAHCRSERGNEQHQPHSSRTQKIARCLYCEAWLAADNPEQFCDGCLP